MVILQAKKRFSNSLSPAKKKHNSHSTVSVLFILTVSPRWQLARRVWGGLVGHKPQHIWRLLNAP